MSADDPAGLNDAARLISQKLADIADVTDIDAGLPLPGVDWELQVDRGEASRYGASPGAVGAVVQLVTSGLKLSDFRPAGSDDAVDFVLRMPQDRRTISALDQLRIETELGPVPISNFVTRIAAPTTGILNRIDGARTVTVQAGIREDVQAQDVRDKVAAMLTDTFAAEKFTEAGIRWTMAGEDQEQAEAGGVSVKGLWCCDFPDFRGVAGAVQQIHLGRTGAVSGDHVFHRRSAGSDDHGAAFWHRDVRYRRHCPGRCGREQQHRADRNL